MSDEGVRRLVRDLRHAGLSVEEVMRAVGGALVEQITDDFHAKRAALLGFADQLGFAVVSETIISHRGRPEELLVRVEFLFRVLIPRHPLPVAEATDEAHPVERWCRERGHHRSCNCDGVAGDR